MNTLYRMLHFAVACLVLTLAACGGGGGGGDGAGGGTPTTGSVVGAAGGTVLGPSGAKVEIPPGALATNTTIGIEQSSIGAPALPAGVTGVGPMFALTPHGTTFAVPASLALPFDAAATVPTGTRLALYKTTAGETVWERVAGATFDGGSASGLINSFSFAQAVTEPLFRGDPVREWTFTAFRGRAMKPFELNVGRQDTAGMDVIIDFGGVAIDQLTQTPLDHELKRLDGSLRAQDGIANGQVFSTADAVTYGAFAEAPRGNPNIEDSPAGGRSVLRQFQAFIKRSPDAKLEFKLTSAFIDLRDDNGGFRSNDAFTAFPGKCVYPPEQVDALDACQDIVRGQITLLVKAYTHATSASTPGLTFFSTGGVATAHGHTGLFTSEVNAPLSSTTPLWSADDFDTEIFPGFNFFIMSLKKPRTVKVDLSSVAVGQEFTLRSTVLAEATDRQGDKFAGGREKPSAAAAFLRDPLSISGTSLVHSGLEVIDSPVLVSPAEVPATPAACATPGGDPQAGVIAFSAAAYTLEGHGGAVQPVRITRTGGTRGAVTATFTTSDGSAVAGQDYTPVNVSVFFADGDAQERLAEIALIPNQTDGEADKTVNLRLADPGNCATLGDNSSAVLTLVDNKAPPPTLATGLDLTFGTAGIATTTAFGGDRSGMALQTDGKIVMVGGTFTDFILARFNADGSLDTSFGVGVGRVVTDMGSGLRQEEALAVAIQPDGRIVVVGHTAIDAAPPAPDLPATFAIARYNSDGSLDTSFGSGGRVSGNVNGIARAVAIQPDGKIVLAGDFELELSNDTSVSDFTVARFNANGSLDLAFGTSGTGQVATDIGEAFNTASNVVLQPNGAIVVSGKANCSQVGCDHTDVVRYNANGTLDASFGSGGKLTLAGKEVGEGLVRQSDGKLVLAGGVTTATVPATARFVLMRLNVDGTADTSFGNAGTVDTASTESATANAVALQGDGKIVAVGTRAFSANPNFIVARYNANGSVDATFGSGGNLSIDFFGFSDAGENVLVQPDGKIVVGGLARNNVDGYGLARINP